MGFKKPQITKVKTDIQSLSIYLRSVKKFGKTTLFRDLILEKFGDPAKGLLVGLGAEVGYSILDNLNATQIEDWDDLEELKEWLITKKGKEHDIQIVAFDVIDELMPMAEDQVIKMSRRETGKPCKSFNAAFGGYSEPRKRLMGLVKGFFTDLKKAGIMPFAISHTKIKSIKEKGEEGEGYHLLTSNLSNDYEAIFGDIFDCVLTGYIDREVSGGKIANETRKLFFRGNGYIDAGCRFASDTVPEYIVFDKPNMAKTFIDTLEEGLRKSRTKEMSKEEFKIEQEKEVVEIQKKAEEFINKDEFVEYTVEVKQEKLDIIKINLSKLDMAKIQEIMVRYNVTSFNDAELVPSKCLDEILDLI